MTNERLLNCRYYRRHPDARAQLFKRIYGRLAYYRRALKRRSDGWAALVKALLVAFLAKKTSHRYVPLRKWSPAKSSLPPAVAARIA